MQLFIINIKKIAAFHSCSAAEFLEHNKRITNLKADGCEFITLGVTIRYASQWFILA